MFQVLPLWGFLFPSPIYHIRQQDAVVTLARRPPEVEYFSFTTFAAWLPGREVPVRSLAQKDLSRTRFCSLPFTPNS